MHVGYCFFKILHCSLHVQSVWYSCASFFSSLWLFLVWWKYWNLLSGFAFVGVSWLSLLSHLFMWFYDLVRYQVAWAILAMCCVLEFELCRLFLFILLLQYFVQDIAFVRLSLLLDETDHPTHDLVFMIGMILWLNLQSSAFISAS